MKTLTKTVIGLLALLMLASCARALADEAEAEPAPRGRGEDNRPARRTEVSVAAGAEVSGSSATPGASAGPVAEVDVEHQKRNMVYQASLGGGYVGTPVAAGEVGGHFASYGAGDKGAPPIKLDARVRVTVNPRVGHGSAEFGPRINWKDGHVTVGFSLFALNVDRQNGAVGYGQGGRIEFNQLAHPIVSLGGALEGQLAYGMSGTSGGRGVSQVGLGSYGALSANATVHVPEISGQKPFVRLEALAEGLDYTLAAKSDDQQVVSGTTERRAILGGGMRAVIGGTF